ncbi:MAG: hypothetical protein WCB11_14460 [Terriglobales bacterium]|jgi:hypothetical protein
MIRLRIGKFCGVGGIPAGNSVTSARQAGLKNALGGAKLLDHFPDSRRTQLFGQ